MRRANNNTRVLSSLGHIKGTRLKLIRGSNSLSHNLPNPIPAIPKQPSAIFLSPLENFNKHSAEPVIYQVDILSNWGHPDRIACSAIWFLDKERHIITPTKISSVPYFSPNLLDKLSGVSLVKMDDNELWNSKWPPEETNQISLVFFLPGDQTPAYARIWNTTSLGDASVRKIQVSCGKETLYLGEIPRCYGTDVQLAQNFVKPTNSFDIIDELFGNKKKSNTLVDKYGTVPLKQVKQVEFTVLDNYGSPKFIGLNAIDFYDENYEHIAWSNIDDIIIKNCARFTDPKKLFKDIKEIDDDNEMFVAEFEKENGAIPKISILFKAPIYISQVVFWNYNSPSRGTDIGVKNVKISMHNAVKWCGKIKKATGIKEAVGASTSAVWFIDIEELYKKEYNTNHM